MNTFLSISKEPLVLAVADLGGRGATAELNLNLYPQAIQKTQCIYIKHTKAH